ncbi:tripartite tricarboxylate transporter TctB family protein [Pseudooceanicola sp.]|jgi:hypothetical protein|uniref:tripartite tricarboxylate transporter TctB family protein n=1 Tax=Pseudooceanicola sp. TaxID=1914328 RepID=UPI004058EDA7
MRRADIASGSVLLIGSLYMILFGIPAQIDAVENATISPRTLPYVCAVAVAALSAILVLMRLRTPAEEGEGGSPLTLGHMVWSGIILGSVLLGLLLLGPAGPLIASASVILILMLALGERRPVYLVALPAGLILLGWLLFYQILGTAVV